MRCGRRVNVTWRISYDESTRSPGGRGEGVIEVAELPAQLSSWVNGNRGGGSKCETRNYTALSPLRRLFPFRVLRLNVDTVVIDGRFHFFITSLMNVKAIVPRIILLTACLHFLPFSLGGRSVFRLDNLISYSRQLFIRILRREHWFF